MNDLWPRARSTHEISHLAEEVGKYTVAEERMGESLAFRAP